jgi:hypothetical protein
MLDKLRLEPSYNLNYLSVLFRFERDWGYYVTKL